jgi:hypothetical protein
LVCAGWLLFRIGDWGHFSDYVIGLSECSFGTRIDALFYAILLIGVVSHVIPAHLDRRLEAYAVRLPAPLQGVLAAGLLLFLCGTSVEAPAFIYFQF